MKENKKINNFICMFYGIATIFIIIEIIRFMVGELI